MSFTFLIAGWVSFLLA